EFTLLDSYEITAANKDFISIQFGFSGDLNGHNRASDKSLNYDLNRNAPISLADLFTQNSNYMKVISDYSIKELKKLGAAEFAFAEERIAPKTENFHCWSIRQVGLEISLDDYHPVGPHEASCHVVVVPYSVLKPIIKSDGLLAQFAK